MTINDEYLWRMARITAKKKKKRKKTKTTITEKKTEQNLKKNE